MIRVYELLIHFYDKNHSADKTLLDLTDVLLKLFIDYNSDDLDVNPFKEKIVMFFVDDNNFLNDITLDDFANYLGYDAGYASRMCVKATGYSFIQYKIYLRLQYAKHLTQSTDIPITEIATKSGFNSLSVFNRFFKADTGYSPSQYRALYRNKNKKR